MWFFNKYCFLSLLIITMTNLGCSAKSHPSIKAKGYVVVSKQDPTSRLMAVTLFNKMQEQSTDKSIITLFSKDIPQEFKAIELDFNINLNHDYCIKLEDDKILISFKNRQDKEWLITQFMGAISKEDHRFKPNNLPESIVQFHTSCKDFDFSYRDPHYNRNLIPGNSGIFGNHNVDSDWGIWGHNLAKVMANYKDSNIYALVDGERNNEQFSFTSTELFDYLTNYIIDNFGEGEEKGFHFMIMPQDNDLVCTCESCLAVGNTKSNATPAVTNFIQKISQRFPKHHFFTSSYITTREVPEKRLNSNTGVFLSTINLKKGVELNLKQSETADFIKEISKWKEVTNNIYIWDYSSNFDDYLTPIPALYGLKKQLQFYKKHGVNGVFLNASGYDYSSFGDLKSYVAGALMKNTDADVDELCNDFLSNYYPKSHAILSEYYLGLEKDYEARNKPYNLYGGFDEISKTYFNPEKFIKFYNELALIIESSENEEREKLIKLYTALTYTKLQIGYSQILGPLGIAELKNNDLVIKPSAEVDLNALRAHSNYQNMGKYKEAKGDLSAYIHFWEQIIIQRRFSNLILNEKIKILSQPNDGYENSKLLTNGLNGFDGEYHQGWYISSKDLNLEINTDNLSDEKKILLRFLNNSKHGFYPPEKIEIWSDDKLLNSKTINAYENDLKSIEIHLSLDFTDINTIEIKMLRREHKKSMIACDEIRILN